MLVSEYIMTATTATTTSVSNAIRMKNLRFRWDRCRLPLLPEWECMMRW